MIKNFIDELCALNERSGFVRINLKVKASAKSNKIDGFLLVNEKQHLKISIKSIPENGKANDEIIKFLSSEFGVRKNYITILAGHTSSIKALEIKNIDTKSLIKLKNII